MPAGAMNRILVVGGSGYFGKLLVQELLEHTEVQVVLAGRNRRRLVQTRATFGAAQRARLTPLVLDRCLPASTRSGLAGVDVAICAAGPYQGLPLTLAAGCLESNIHYIDLCDDRGFVRDVHRLVRERSRQKNLPAICTGWSAVPALSGALVGIAAIGWDRIDSIDIQIAPGNRAPRSLGTVSSLLSSLGKQFTVFREGAWQTVEGWSEPRCFEFPLPVGRRAAYLVDVPDLGIFPDLFGAERVEFRVGSELALLNRAVSMLAWLARRKMLPRSKAARALLRGGMALLGFLGHDCGVVGVKVCGSRAGAVIVRQASVVADRMGHRIPVMPAVIMAKRLLSGAAGYGGIVPVNSWLSREQLAVECGRRGYRLVIEQKS